MFYYAEQQDENLYALMYLFNHHWGTLWHDIITLCLLCDGSAQRKSHLW